MQLLTEINLAMRFEATKPESSPCKVISQKSGEYKQCESAQANKQSTSIHFTNKLIAADDRNQPILKIISVHIAPTS